MDGGGGETRTTTTTTATSSSGDASGRATTSATSGAGNTSADVSAAFALTLSVVSSVSIVIVNKHLISILGFREGETASSTTAVTLCVFLRSARAARDAFDGWMFCGNFSGMMDLNESAPSAEILTD